MPRGSSPVLIVMESHTKKPSIHISLFPSRNVWTLWDEFVKLQRNGFSGEASATVLSRAQASKRNYLDGVRAPSEILGFVVV